MSNNLNKIISDEIKNNGPMGLGAFTTMALCYPEFGYYMGADPFGVEGDFITAPEISQMFGEVIGAWVIDVWKQLGQPEKINLIECGPGRATLMSDILRSGKSVGGFIDAVQLHLIESSDTLRERQKDTLKEHNISWHMDLSGVEGDDPCIILGNEFLDALPIEQLKRTEGGWKKRGVIVKDTQPEFKSIWVEVDDALTQFLPSKTQSEQIYEVAPARIEFITACVNLLNKSTGAALFIDYGYTKSTYGDTLQALKAHKFVDVLKDVGACDITSHVDFDALSRCVSAQGMHVESISPQGRFLIALGIEHRLLVLKNTALKTVALGDASALIKDMENSVERLIEEKQMGDLFKVMCFHSGNGLKPAGF
ncbi:MAG: SAM-dependent methyltransferase [Zetaproteobacteria bacterium]|nr:MAG: SAM-dependent methyltransferase [Zetaproteobacteria bacterium]